MYLGYFDTLEELLNKYTGLKGNFAVVGTSIVVYNGEEWITPNDTVETAELRVLIEEESKLRRTDVEKLTGRIDALSVTGIEIKWSYKDTIGASEDDPQGWSDSPLEATEDNQVVYISSRVKTQDSGWSYWSEPRVFVRYVPQPKDGDGYQQIYKGKSTDDAADALHQQLQELYLREDYQSDDFDFVNEGWFEHVIEPDSDKSFVYVAQRKKKNGKWGAFSYPVIVYRWVEPQSGEDGENAKVIVLSNERVAIACDKDGKPTGDDVAITYVHFYDGSTLITDGVELDCVSDDITPTIRNNEFVAIIDEDTPKYNVVYITAKYKGATYQAPWIIEKIIPATDGVSPKVYAIKMSEVVAKLNGNGGFENSEVSLNVYRTFEEEAKPLSDAEFLSDGLSWEIEADEVTATKKVAAHGFLMMYGDAEIANDDSNTSFDATFRESLRLKLKKGDTILDTQTLRVVANGEDGLSPILVDVADTITIACDAEGYVLDDEETGVCNHATQALSNSSFHIDVKLRQGADDVTSLLMYDSQDGTPHCTASYPKGKGISEVLVPTAVEPTSYHVSLLQPDKTASVIVTLHIAYEWNGVIYYVDKRVKIIRNFAGKEGTIDYGKVEEIVIDKVATRIDNAEQWAQIRTEIGNLQNGLGEVVGDYAKESALSATAYEIMAEVSKKVSGEELKQAGVSITADGVSLYGDQVKIQQSKDSETPTALFKDGYLNASLINASEINTQVQMCYDSNGNLRASINRYGRGEFIQYYELDPNSVFQEPSKRIEYSLDAETESIIRMYNTNGSIQKMIGFDLVAKDPPSSGAEDWELKSLAYVGEERPTVVLQRYTTNSYWLHKGSGVLYKTRDTSLSMADDGWYTDGGESLTTPDGLSWGRNFIHYVSGKVEQALFITSIKDRIDLTV